MDVFACICFSGCFHAILILSFHPAICIFIPASDTFVVLSSSTYTPLAPGLNLPPSKQRFVLGYCLTCFAKVFIFCNADIKLFSSMFPEAGWLRQHWGRLLGEARLPSLTPPEIWKESQRVQNSRPGDKDKGETEVLHQQQALHLLAASWDSI